MCIALAYGFTSMLLGFWWELEVGDPWDSSVLRTFRGLGFAVLWPVLVGVSVWFWFTLDPEDPFL